MVEAQTNSALLVIDMQKFFFEENPDIDPQLVENCQEVIDCTREAGMPIIHIVTEYNEDQSDWPPAWRGDKDAWCSNLLVNQEGAEVVDGLIRKPEDLCVVKKRFSAFYNTELDTHLEGLSCERLYAIGYAADVCVRFTLEEAYNRGYETSVIKEGVASFREPTELSLGYLSMFFNTEVLPLSAYRTIISDEAS